MNDVRTLPHSIDAEQSVIGALMLDPSRLDRVAGRLVESDFYRADHRLIYASILKLAGRNQPVDGVTLGEWFAAQGLADSIGDEDYRGVGYLYHLANTQASAANVGAYAEIVREKSLLRRVIDGCARVIEMAYNPGDKTAEQLIDSTVGGMMRLHKAEQNVECNLHEALGRAFDHILRVHELDGALPGLTTGLEKLDEHLGGFHPGDLVVIGGRPSMGKTAMLIGMARAAALTQASIGIVSGEQPAQQLGMRFLALASQVPASRMRSAKFDGNDWPMLSGAVAAERTLPVQIMDRSSPTISEVARLARRWKREHGIKALYVDYLQRMQAPGEKRWEQVAVIARGLKDIARDLDIPVIALAQVKRDVELRSDKRPRMADLCDSSEIEKEADQILTIYRDDYYHADSKFKGTVEILIDKNRHGETAFCRLAWLAQTMRFANLESDWQEPKDEIAERREQKREPRRKGKSWHDKAGNE